MADILLRGSNGYSPVEPPPLESSMKREASTLGFRALLTNIKPLLPNSLHQELLTRGVEAVTWGLISYTRVTTKYTSPLIKYCVPEDPKYAFAQETK